MEPNRISFVGKYVSISRRSHDVIETASGQAIISTRYRSARDAYVRWDLNSRADMQFAPTVQRTVRVMQLQFVRSARPLAGVD